jgi:hypothetical protein
MCHPLDTLFLHVQIEKFDRGAGRRRAIKLGDRLVNTVDALNAISIAARRYLGTPVVRFSRTISRVEFKAVILLLGKLVQICAKNLQNQISKMHKQINLEISRVMLSDLSMRMFWQVPPPPPPQSPPPQHRLRRFSISSLATEQATPNSLFFLNIIKLLFNIYINLTIVSSTDSS